MFTGSPNIVVRPAATTLTDCAGPTGATLSLMRAPAPIHALVSESTTAMVTAPERPMSESSVPAPATPKRSSRARALTTTPDSPAARNTPKPSMVPSNTMVPVAAPASTIAPSPIAASVVLWRMTTESASPAPTMLVPRVPAPVSTSTSVSETARTATVPPAVTIAPESMRALTTLAMSTMSNEPPAWKCDAVAAETPAEKASTSSRPRTSTVTSPAASTSAVGRMTASVVLAIETAPSAAPTVAAPYRRATPAAPASGWDIRSDAAATRTLWPAEAPTAPSFTRAPSPIQARVALRLTSAPIDASIAPARARPQRRPH